MRYLIAASVTAVGIVIGGLALLAMPVVAEQATQLWTYISSMGG